MAMKEPGFIWLTFLSISSTNHDFSMHDFAVLYKCYKNNQKSKMLLS